MTEHVGFEAGKKPPHVVVVALQFTTALAQSRQRCANLLIRTGDRREPIVCEPIDGRTLVAPLARRLEPESADLNTFAPLTLTPNSVSVVDGSICLEFAPEDRAAFFRFNVE